MTWFNSNSKDKWQEKKMIELWNATGFLDLFDVRLQSCTSFVIQQGTSADYYWNTMTN